ncbi:helix-turn-helix domain-containing protein [Parabacteroides distasonis]|uniref:helix-turn-helix domain-containing protein n=1 Tax=Parabacteroides distasonis TaxID=823 RepID=UPI0018A990B6|nr:helix-turn-helix domain-containing protein [Parabacteroides distasonis]MDB9027574.1 helix-turn-helix domain containing protein [Parabacteroides distasonis]MDB9044356.1 helix-turn-helix domain containing protein [Parabacteroides distasonis]MDB9090167.1 helix-turn-helix domain containing protein [Parabacteroides distasonis]MDB9162546.1 helix-turn-helix domain containing protein [Parabacteroides distasonis]
MSRHHTLAEKQEILRLHEEGASMVELMTRFHVSDYYLYILFGRYKKYGIDGLENYKKTVISLALKLQIIKEYEEDCLPLWQLCVKYDVSHSSICRWIQQYKLEDMKNCTVISSEGDQSRIWDDQKRKNLKRN